MSIEYSEDHLVEQATQDVLEDLGWQVEYAWIKETFGKDGLLGCDNKSEVVLKRYLWTALQKFNPQLPVIAYQNALDQIIEKTADKKLPLKGRKNTIEKITEKINEFVETFVRGIGAA